MLFIKKLRLSNLLSFPPNPEQAFELQPLNVLIGPNGAGKSNVIEALELLRATPTDFATAIRDGGGADEWLWKGEDGEKTATVEIETGEISTGLATPTGRSLRYRLEFTSTRHRVEVVDEAIEEAKPLSDHDEPYFYYRFNQGRPVINITEQVQNSVAEGDKWRAQYLKRDDLAPDQSVLAQRKDPELYPEITWIGRKFGEIQTFREWTFGRFASLRQPQPADLPDDRLLPNNRNLGLILNQIEIQDPQRFKKIMKIMRRFFPRFEGMVTGIQGGAVQFYLHEPGFNSPIASTRLSDGTIRFMAILAILLAPSPPPLVCIEEPELGLHPDAAALLGKLLVEASERMQLVVTTHSDALVSALTSQPESVVLCERPGAGTTLRRLDSEELTQELNDYTLGDLWRMGHLGANP